MSRHVYEWDNTVYTKDQLPDLINTIIKSPFSIHDKISPWDQILVHFTDGGVCKSCLVVRTSHAMADGTAIVSFFVNNVADEPAVLLKPPDVSSSLKMFMKMKGWFNLPLTFIQSLSVPFPSHDLHNVRLQGTKNITWSQPISLKLIKAIKNKLHVTVNDVLLGCLATKLHQYFKDAGKSPPKEFTAGVPFNTRFSMEEADQLRNKFAVVLVRIPTEGSDVVKNIKELRNQMNALKLSAQNHGLRLGMRLMNYSLPLFIVRYLHGLFVARLSMVLSNVPGPQLPFKFDGTAVESMCFVPPARNRIGVSVSLISYCENVFITACCDDALWATSGQLLQGFPELFLSVAQQLGVEGATIED